MKRGIVFAVCAALCLGISAGAAVSANDNDFIRGDVNGSGEVDVSDAVLLFSLFFNRSQGREVDCNDALDANDSGYITLMDVFTIFRQQFLGDRTLPAPYPACGADPTDDRLGCESYEFCEEDDDAAESEQQVAEDEA